MNSTLYRYGKFHPHPGAHDYKSYLAGVRACGHQRCKKEVFAAACDTMCRSLPCAKCDRKLFDIRDAGWLHACQCGLTGISIEMPPRWLIPSLRAQSPDVVMAARINTSLSDFITDVGVHEPWSDKLYSADQWYYVPDFWMADSPILYIHANDDIEIQILANTNIRCILHSGDSLRVAVITRATYKLTHKGQLTRAVSNMCDGFLCYVDTLRHTSHMSVFTHDKACPCYQRRCFHCLNHYKYTRACEECMRIRDTLRNTRIAVIGGSRLDRHTNTQIVVPHGDLSVDPSEWAPDTKSEDECFLDSELEGYTSHNYDILPIDDFASYATPAVGKYTWTTD